MRKILPKDPLSPLIGALVAVLLAIYGPKLFYQYWPLSFWFEYYSVEQVSETVKIGDPLKLRSTRIIRRPVILQWDDSLRCVEPDGGYPPFSKSDSFSRLVDDAPPEKETVIWTYYGELPKHETTCFTHHVITALLPHGIRRNQIINHRHYIEFVK